MSAASCANFSSPRTSSNVISGFNVDMGPFWEVIEQNVAENVKNVLISWDATSPDKAISLDDLKRNIGTLKPMPPAPCNGDNQTVTTNNQFTVRWCRWSDAINKIRNHNVNINIFKDNAGREKVWYQTEMNTIVEDNQNVEILYVPIVENHADESEKDVLYEPTAENHADEPEKEVLYEPIVENHTFNGVSEHILWSSNEQQTSSTLFSTSALNVDNLSALQAHYASSFNIYNKLVNRFCANIQLLCQQFQIVDSTVPLSAIKDWWEDDHSERFPDLRRTFSWEFILQVLKDSGFQLRHENGVQKLFYGKKGMQRETNLNSEIIDLAVPSTSMNETQNSPSDVTATEPVVSADSIVKSNNENVTPNETDCSSEIDTSFNCIVSTEMSILSPETNEKQLRRILKRKDSAEDSPGGLKKKVKFGTPISSVRTFFKNSLIEIDPEEPLYECNKCNRKYKVKSSLTRHYKRSHVVSGPE